MGLVTQQDPIGIAGGLNLYGYANGDPVNQSDPLGLCPWCVAGAVIGGGVAAAVAWHNGESLKSVRTWGKMLVAAGAGAASGGVSALGAEGLAAIGANAVIGASAGGAGARIDGGSWGSAAQGAAVGGLVGAGGAALGTVATAVREIGQDATESVARSVISGALQAPGDVRFTATLDELMEATGALSRGGSAAREGILGATAVGLAVGVGEDQH